MILTISAAQGQGKTTILNHLEEKGYHVQKNTTAREILSEWDESLNNVYSNPHLAKMFQNEILKRQQAYDDINNASNKLIITERSYADIFTYALFAVGNINDFNVWLNQYYNECCKLQNNYRNVFFLTGRDYVPEDDGVRSVNHMFGSSVDMMVEHFTNDMAANNCQVIKINSDSLSERLDIIEKHLWSVT